MSKLSKVRTQSCCLLVQAAGQTSRAQGKSKSKVTEISESDSSKQVEETWPPNTAAPQPSLSQVNTIGRAGEGLWIFSLEDSKKRRYTVNWEDQSDYKTEEHELMIDSGCFGHVCPPWFAPQFPVVSSHPLLRLCRVGILPPGE